MTADFLIIGGGIAGVSILRAPWQLDARNGTGLNGI